MATHPSCSRHLRAWPSLMAALFAAGAVVLPLAAHASYVPRTPPLTTPWTGQVSLTSPLPEYPRPQLTRSEWQSLNGLWQFQASTQTDVPPVGQTLPETVLVPYPIESALSGIQRHETNMWYRRTFTVPSSWSGRRVQLQFGAVNWQAAVWVNGRRIGGHTGAYDAFAFDITAALTAGSNELIVGIYSPVDSAGIPVGKQRLAPSGIFYTAASGIWQTVWIEPTPAAHITRLDTTPDVPGGALDLVVQTAGGTAAGVHVDVLAAGQVVGSADGIPGQHVRVPVPRARLWSPDDPFLYDLQVTLTGAGGGDSVGGYFGMRSVAKAVVNGFLRPVLNGQFVFQIGTLDQGYWPDGIYTAPTDDALKFDLEQQKRLGFNTVRKHIKVEPARWYYWADRLGLWVWQDMPAMARAPSATDQANFESELHRMIDQLRGITSIVQWLPFNEGWGEYDPARIAALVKRWDPTRLVDNNSGSNCCGSDGGNGDVIDDHIYVGPGTTNLPSTSRVAVLGEFGGIALPAAGHDWPVLVSPYSSATDAHDLTARYVETTATLQGLIFGRGLSASIYTQPTDVEGEINGLWTYDRQVFKPDSFDQVRAANLAIVAAAGGLRRHTLISLGATTSCCTDRYVRHAGGLGVTSPVTAASDDVTRQDATFWLRPGLADAACYSFESRNAPGSYLRHASFRVRRDANDGSALFAADATFCARTGHTASGIALESFNVPGRFLRHIDAELYIASDGGPNRWDNPASWADDTTWQIAAPWWRSAVTLPTGTAQSLQVVTAGFTDRYLRHFNSLAFTEVVTASSDATLRADASFLVRPGLADPSCYSFESRNFQGHFLRHASFRLRKDPSDGTALFASDATFCALPGRSGGDVTLGSYNLAGYNIRHENAEVWIASPGGPRPWEAAASYDADVTWHLVPAWAP